LLHAVIRAESGYNPEAVSPKGAAGLMQLMPATASRMGVRDRFDPQDNIEGGARYLSQLLDMFPSDIKLAVAAYNSGENAVKRHGNQIPPYSETQTYVDRVLNYYSR
jgi:soluble lytic murein transglycosylase-like protein